MLGRLCLSLGVVASLAACATGSTVTVIPSPALAQVNGPKSPESIKVFRESPADGSYVSVAVIEANQAPLLPDDAAAVLGKMLARAGELGCDGLVLEAQAQRFGSAGPRVTYGWNGLLAALPADAVIAQPWFAGHIAPRAANPASPEHWTLEGYRAECVVLR